jgi:hypothetical protein
LNDGKVGRAHRLLTGEYGSIYADILANGGSAQAAANFKQWVDAIISGKGKLFQAFLKALGL